MPDVKDKILDAIHLIVNRKLNSGEAFPCAHSIEVAHILKMNAREVEIIAQDIEEIKIHLTINGAYYET